MSLINKDDSKFIDSMLHIGSVSLNTYKTKTL